MTTTVLTSITTVLDGRKGLIADALDKCVTPFSGTIARLGRHLTWRKGHTNMQHMRRDNVISACETQDS